MPTPSVEIIFVQHGRLLQWLHTQPTKHLKIGDGPGCDFFVEGLSPTPLLGGCAELSPSWTLEEFSTQDRDGFSLHFPSGCRITVRRSAPASALPDKRRPKRRELAPYLLGSAALHSLLLFLLFQIDPNRRRVTLTPPASTNQIVSAKMAPDEITNANIPTLRSEKMNKGLLGKDQGKLHSQSAGAMGKKRAKHFYGMYKIQGDSDSPKPSRIASVVSQVGILSVIKGNNVNGSPFASVFGREEMEHSDTETILGGLYGYQHNESEGGYGLGLRGTGIGGSFKGEGTLGAGSFGFGRAGAGGSCDDTCSIGLGGYGTVKSIGVGSPTRNETHKAGGPEISEGRADVIGGMDKSTIRRVIQRAMPGIKYCYEQGLQRQKGLQGKVLIQFIIGPTGAVLDARATAGIEAGVDQCVTKKISQLAFPAPRDVVEVNYPFYFQAK